MLDLSQGTLECHSERIRSLSAMQRPTNRKGCRQYTGALNFLSDCLPKAKLILTPIYALCGQSKQRFLWSQDCENAFQDIKIAFAKLAILIIPDPSKPFYIACDRGGFYAVFQRSDRTQKLQACRYSSKIYTGSVANYSQHKSECYILITAITNESFWLTFSQTFIFSDAHSLTYLARYAPHSEILWSWSRLICSYQITIIHLPATSDIIGGFCDLFTRDPKSLKKSLREKIGKTRLEDTPLISFHGLAPLRIQDIMNILSRYMNWYLKTIIKTS